MNPKTNGEYKVLRNAIKVSGRKKFIYIDGGANIGESSLKACFFSNRLNKKIQIIAIEPIKETFKALKENTKSIDILLIEKALGSKSKQVKFRVDKEHPCSGRNAALNHYYLNKEGTEIAIQVTLDQLALDLNLTHIDFLKLDIEGLELDAIFGAEKLMSHGAIDYIQLEYNQTWILAKASIEKLLNFISKKKYSLYRIASNELLKISSYHYTIEDFYYSNLLLVREGCPLPLRCLREASPVTIGEGKNNL